MHGVRRNTAVSGFPPLELGSRCLHVSKPSLLFMVGGGGGDLGLNLDNLDLDRFLLLLDATAAGAAVELDLAFRESTTITRVFIATAVPPRIRA